MRRITASSRQRWDSRSTQPAARNGELSKKGNWECPMLNFHSYTDSQSSLHVAAPTRRRPLRMFFDTPKSVFKHHASTTSTETSSKSSPLTHSSWYFLIVFLIRPRRDSQPQTKKKKKKDDHKKKYIRHPGIDTQNSRTLHLAVKVFAWWQANRIFYKKKKKWSASISDISLDVKRMTSC